MIISGLVADGTGRRYGDWRHVATGCNVLVEEKLVGRRRRQQLTTKRHNCCCLSAPQQPKKPTTKATAPTAMKMRAAYET